jgi:hypothetical protein
MLGNQKMARLEKRGIAKLEALALMIFIKICLMKIG